MENACKYRQQCRTEHAFFVRFKRFLMTRQGYPPTEHY